MKEIYYIEVRLESYQTIINYRDTRNTRGYQGREGLREREIDLFTEAVLDSMSRLTDYQEQLQQ